MHSKTRAAFLWTRLLSTPFYVLFTLLPFILHRDVGASLFQVTTIIVLKPAFSLLAPYWSVSIIKRPDRLLSNLAWANFLKYIPFLFIPMIDSVAYFTFASMVYLVLGRGVIPAWMEILKLNIPSESRTKVFAYGQAFDYLGIALFPLLFGWMLDSYDEAWRWLFFATALVGILSTAFLYLIPKSEEMPMKEAISLSDALAKPWKVSWDLLKTRPDFLKFQQGFFLGGAGLMVLQPALPVFFNDTLQLSYKEIGLATAFCKGIGYALMTPFWARLFEKVNIFRFCSEVTLLAALFPLLLLASTTHIAFLWAAYLVYGVMQGGSELSWHLSGPVFSLKGESSAFSQTNILTQGVRGVVVPFLGLLINNAFGAEWTLISAVAFCLAATYVMRKEQVKAVVGS